MCTSSYAVLIVIIVILAAVATMPSWKPQFCGTCTSPLVPHTIGSFAPSAFSPYPPGHPRRAAARARKSSFGVAPFGSCGGWSPDATAEKDAEMALGA